MVKKESKNTNEDKRAAALRANLKRRKERTKTIREQKEPAK